MCLISTGTKEYWLGTISHGRVILSYRSADARHILVSWVINLPKLSNDGFSSWTGPAMNDG